MAKKKNTLLSDAIADAKAVRETALANAKAALEEAFTPHLTSMLSARLREEENDEDEYGEVEEINDPIPAADGHGSDEGGETDVDAVEKSSFTEAAVDVDTGVQSDSKLDSSDIATGPENEYGDMNAKEPAQAARSSSNIDNEDKLGMNEADFDEFEDDEEDEFGGGEMLGAQDEIPGDEVDVAPEMGAVAPEIGGEPEIGGGEMDMGGGDEMGMDMGDEDEEDLDLEAIIRELEAVSKATSTKMSTKTT